MSAENADYDPFEGLRLRVGIAVVAICAGVVALTWSLLPPPLPKLVRLGTGPPDSHYARFGERLASRFVQDRIRLEPVATAGSSENVKALIRGDIDVALIQSGDLSHDDSTQLEAVASVFLEPLLVVHAGPPRLDLRGMRLAIGEPGSGTHSLSLRLLADQGLVNGDAAGTRFVEIGGEAAVKALQAGEVDLGVFVTSLDVPWVHVLFSDPALTVEDFPSAKAFTRHYRFLRRVVVPTGLVDLGLQIPDHDVEVMATTVSLVVRRETHRGLIQLLIMRAREELFQGSLLAEPETFPSPHGVGAPLASEARNFFERGPSFLYRWLPFRLAFFAQRLGLLLIPLLTLLYPLLRGAGPAYRWLVQRRIYRWYKVLRQLESRLEGAGDAERRAQVRKELESVGDFIREIRVPARFGAELFQLRHHHRLLLERIERIDAGRG